MTTPPNPAVVAFWADLEVADKAALASAETLLNQIFNSAPYLFDIAQKNTPYLIQIVNGDPDALFQKIQTVLGNAGQTFTDEPQLSEVLRTAKSQTALLAAIAEISGVWTPAQSTAALADLADAALEAGLDFLVRQSATNGTLACSPEQATAAQSGLAIFALGKHGGRELNYSSDIDIVAFYECPEGLLADSSEAGKYYARLVRHLVALIDDRTENGYVFRTDLRLRPDPGSTPVAISTDAAMSYYESRGQNWERAAWIKARPAAGDIRVADKFLKDLAPFIWRKHLDFATIADIQAMKRQINIARNVGAARVAGHNVKLGRGGIREIEFFTQTQQLIAGGRDPSLRVRPTADALAALAHSGWITAETAAGLTDAYWFLRAVENRLQMLRDEQTQTMPETEEGVAIIAALMGMSDAHVFETRYREALSLVMGHYAELFTEGATLANDMGDLVFTGSDDDPGTLDTLQGLGFADAAKVSATIRRWHYGSYPATRSSTSRAHLTELLPDLLTIIAAAGNADDTFAQFDRFLSRFPAGVQLFSLLRSHPHLCRLLVAFMASAPRLAEAVIHRAHVMDGLIDPAFADGVTRTEILTEKVDSFLREARSFEDLIDRARIIGQEQKFLISAGFASATIGAHRAGQQFTTLAETLLVRIFDAVRAEFVKKHGIIGGAEVAVLAFGKLASCEMTLLSDLDFIMLYDVDGSDAESDGEKPLAASQYFARLTQRLVAALSAPTAEGVLYETDMRLRPSGNAGPLATSLKGFTTYQIDSAWTWEHMALSRARVVIGEQDFTARICAVINRALSQPRTNSKIVDDVLSMRDRLANERKPRHPFDLKRAIGGLIDIEFVAQSAQLLLRRRLGLSGLSISDTLMKLNEAGYLPDAERLVLIHQTYSAILQAMSISLLDPFKPEGWTNAFKVLLAQLVNYPSFANLEVDLKVMQADVTDIAQRWYALAPSLPPDTRKS